MRGSDGRLPEGRETLVLRENVRLILGRVADDLHIRPSLYAVFPKE